MGYEHFFPENQTSGQGSFFCKMKSSIKAKSHWTQQFLPKKPNNLLIINDSTRRNNFKKSPNNQWAKLWIK